MQHIQHALSEFPELTEKFTDSTCPITHSFLVYVITPTHTPSPTQSHPHNHSHSHTHTHTDTHTQWTGAIKAAPPPHSLPCLQNYAHMPTHSHTYTHTITMYIQTLYTYTITATATHTPNEMEQSRLPHPLSISPKMCAYFSNMLNKTSPSVTYMCNTQKKWLVMIILQH